MLFRAILVGLLSTVNMNELEQLSGLLGPCPLPTAMQTHKDVARRPHARWVSRDKACAVFLFGPGEPAPACASAARSSAPIRCLCGIARSHGTSGVIHESERCSPGNRCMTTFRADFLPSLLPPGPCSPHPAWLHTDEDDADRRDWRYQRHAGEYHGGGRQIHKPPWAGYSLFHGLVNSLE